MKENYRPCVAKMTGYIMSAGLFCTVWMFGLFGISIYFCWAVCVGVTFLCEYLFKRKNRKQFTTNIGAIIATALMGIGLTVTLLIQYNRSKGSSPLIDFSDAARDITLIMFLPPMIVSLIVNICNIIYKAGNHSDQQL